MNRWAYNPNSLPDYLRELASPTPNGYAKLLAAWDGLTGHKAPKESASNGG